MTASALFSKILGRNPLLVELDKLNRMVPDFFEIVAISLSDHGAANLAPQAVAPDPLRLNQDNHTFGALNTLLCA